MLDHLHDYLTAYAQPVLAGAVFLAIAWLIALAVDRVVRYVLIERAGLDRAAAVALARAVRIAVVVLAAIAVLEELGVEVAGLIAALGIFGFTLAIGLRTTTTNFFTGVMLLILKPYKIGEHIEGERVEGVVEEMTVFHTVVVTEDGTYVAVPNGAMWARSVKNLSRPRPRRVDLDISVARGMPYEALRPVVEKALGEEAALSPMFPPLVRVLNVTQSALMVRAAVWCAAEDTRDVAERLAESLRAALTAAGAEVRSVRATRKRRVRKAPTAAPPPADDDAG